MDRRLLALALLVVLAGCGSVIGEDEPAEAVTPAPVVTPEAPTETGPVELAPGVTADGIQDVRELFDTHLAVLTNTSFAWTERYREHGAEERGSYRLAITRTLAYEVRTDGYTYRSERRRAVSGDRRQVFVRQRFGTQDGGFERTFTAGEDDAEVRQLDRALGPRALALPDHPVPEVIVLQNQTVRRVDVGERPHYEVRGSRPALSADGVTDQVESRVILRADGLVRRVNVSLVSPVYGEPVANQYTVTYTGVDTTTVEPPAWLDDLEGGKPY